MAIFVNEERLSVTSFTVAHNTNPLVWNKWLSNELSKSSPIQRVQITFQCAEGILAVVSTVEKIAGNYVIVRGGSKIPLTSIVALTMTTPPNDRGSKYDHKNSVVMIALLAVVFFILLLLFLVSI